MRKVIAMMSLCSLIASAIPAIAGDAGAKVLMVVTSAGRMSSGKPTGLWLEEFAVPFLLFKEAGFEITVVSPKGGKVPLDPASLNEKENFKWATASQALEDSVPLEQVSSNDYMAVFLPGGHGTMIDFPNNEALKNLLNGFSVEDKIIAAVCHGPAGLVGMKNTDGTALVAGKTITAFTDAEEIAVNLDKVVPFLLETRLRSEGANFVVGEKWAAHVQVDGKLVTGQNPASSEEAAKAVIRLLQQP